jgi:hypothetical protein
MTVQLLVIGCQPITSVMSEIVFIDKTLEGFGYRKLLYLGGHLDNICKENASMKNLIFQQDNATAHHANTKEWFRAKKFLYSAIYFFHDFINF